MDTIIKLITWLKTLAIAHRILACIMVLLGTIIVLFSCTACGTTRAVVHTKDSGTATITITTNNPIDVSTTPNVNIELPTTQIN